MWFYSEWIIPITSAPIHRGWIEISDHKILSIQDFPPSSKAITDLGNSILLPSLINAHIHLEWSHRKQNIPNFSHFIEWLQFIKQLDHQHHLSEQDIQSAIDDVYYSGTSVICEITNTKKTIPFLNNSPLISISYEEIVGWNIAQLCNPTPHINLTPHSLHGLKPNIIQSIIRQHPKNNPLSIHFAESPEEIEFLENNSGSFKDFFNRHYPLQPIPSPEMPIVDYGKKMGLDQIQTLLVHGVQLNKPYIHELEKWKTSLCLCPRSNSITGVGTAPFHLLNQSSLNLCLGTDGLSSNHSLNLFDEMQFLNQIQSVFTPEQILKMGTINAAKALNIDDKYGSLEPQKTNDILVFKTNDPIEKPYLWLLDQAPHQLPDRITKWIHL